MKNWRVCVGVLLTLLQPGLYGSVSAADAGITIEQLNQLKRLSSGERETLFNTLTSQQSSSRDSSTTSPDVVEQDKSATDVSPATQTTRSSGATASGTTGNHRIRAGDTLLLQMTPRPATEADGAEQRFPDKRIFVLDDTGGMAIPNFGRIILAGLTEAQAAERITAEPAFRDYKVVVKLLPVERELKSFGYDLFQGGADSFAPVTDIPIPDDYVIGPGDTVAVQLFGKENAQYDLVITRDGELLFPGIGPIPVAGMTFSQLQQEIHDRVQKQLIGVQASVTLGRLRSIRIFVLGDVERPGSYTVSGLSTLTNALFASGGVRTIGSLRNIQLKRQGKVEARMDLYDLLLRGDTRSDARLLPGDVIFVPPVGLTAGITGGVLRPAIYELKDEKTIDDLIAMAGGLSPDAYPQGVQIERILRNSERSQIDIDLTRKGAGDTSLQDGDVVRIHTVLEQMNHIVTLSGHVQRPGTYQWQADMRLTDLIPSISQTLPGVDGRYVLIKREDPVERTFELLGANLMAALEDPHGYKDPPLRPHDEVIVFDIHGDRSAVIDPLLNQVRAQSAPDSPVREVSIHGMVHHPGVYPLSPRMKISDLLAAAGGLMDRAYILNAELTRFAVVDGKYREQSLTTVNLEKVFNHRDEDIALQAYDKVIVRRIPNWQDEGSIQILGEVRFPGEYPVKRGEKLSDVIERAGGVTGEAYPDGAVFLRESIRQREQEELDRLSMQLEQDLALIKNTNDDRQAVRQSEVLLGQMRSAEAVGRMVIDLDAILEHEEGFDVTLQDGDRLYIPPKPEVVTVIGEVHYPTSHIYNGRNTLKKYIKLSGGLTDNANKKAIYVIHVDGSVTPAPRWFSSGLDLGPGDTIVIPPKVERLTKLQLYTDISQVLYQLAVTAASLKVLNIF